MTNFAVSACDAFTRCAATGGVTHLPGFASGHTAPRHTNGIGAERIYALWTVTFFITTGETAALITT